MATRARIPIGPPPPPRRRSRPSRRGAWGVLLALIALLAIAAVAVIAIAGSGVTLAGDPTALARLDTQPFAGSLESAQAFAPDGRSIPLSFANGRLTPRSAIRAGELVTIRVTVRRPSWLAWALGSTRTEQLTVRAPSATVISRWLTVPAGNAVRVAFAAPVTAVAYGSAGHLVRQTLPGPQRTVTLLNQAASGVVQVAAAVRGWEQLSAPVTVHWFPPPPADA